MGFKTYSLLMLLAGALTFQPAWAAGQRSTPEKPDSAKASDRSPRVPTFNVNGDLAGQLGVFTTRYEDTFAEVGSQLALGYLELVKANPGVDPWLPGEGTTITLPRQYVLPEARREGIVINLAEYRLYYFTEDGVQVYPVGVGSAENPSPLTDAKVTMPLESPAWYPPASIRAEYEASGDFLPRMIPPGPENPLGTHALLLSEKGYLIHGTNKLFGVGMPVSHGCFRMYNEDISRFVYQVNKGTSVQIVNDPVKMGLSGGEVWLEVHRPHEEYSKQDRDRLWREVTLEVEAFRKKHPGVEVQRRAIELAVDQADGIPAMVGEQVARLAADKTSEDSQPVASEKPEQKLYF
ncbi:MULTISPECIES: L,D-transpeptidase family protein [unclassified Marinobacter]|uniref:L,D-transpeptidase family protein n=1 Tax=unclassified Marinobacter TaxID=83889 RepID=UPI0026E3B631|nr:MULTISPECIES: L,D-transpeptidase family protein [unclassified Marinobacter]MDO6441891.1 L,D-transpeptidase family protein [Marinobacter sp. 2_MG-2023]MDO6824724.1 L,D-transpeptidase family protein [Marinobacter sp. 1_MG-2023]